MLFGRVDRVATLLSRDAERIKELRILRLRTSLLRLCILCLALSGPPLWGGEVPGVTLVFHVKWGAGEQTGLAFATRRTGLPIWSSFCSTMMALWPTRYPER